MPGEDSQSWMQGTTIDFTLNAITFESNEVTIGLW